MVVVVLEGMQHGCSVSLVDDQETVEEFAADRRDEALGNRVRPRCAHRCLDDPNVDGGEDGVEGSGELGVAVTYKEPEAPSVWVPETLRTPVDLPVRRRP